MLTAAVLWCLQTSQARIDVREPAAVGSVIAERLGKAFGVKIYAGEGIAEVPLIFSVKGVTFDEFRPIAAEGLDASWRQVRDGWELYRTKQQLDQEEQHMLQRRAAQVRKAFAERIKEPSLAQDKLEDLALKIKLASDEELEELAYGDPIVSDESMLYDVWQDLGASYFVGLPIDQRWVYTSDGRGGTKKLAVLADVVRRARHERERVVSALQKSGAWARLQSSATSAGTEEYLYWLGLGDVESLVVEVVSTQTGIALSLSGFDKAGKSCLGYYDSLYMEDPERSTLLDRVEDKKVALCPESVAVRKELFALFSDEDRSVENTYASLFANLADRDILSYEVSDVLFEIASTLDQPLIGRLNDNLIESLGMHSLGMEDQSDGAKLTIKSGLTWLDEHLQVAAPTNGGIIVRPEIPKRYQTSFPRKAVSEYVRANHGKKLVDLARLPSVMVAPGSLDAESMAEVAFLAHGSMESMWNVDFSIAATWAALNQQQKLQAATKEGVTIPLSRCGERLRHDFQYAAVSYGQWSMLIGSPETTTTDVHADVGALYEDDGVEDWMLFDVSDDTFSNLKVNVRTSRELQVQMYMDESGEGTDISASELAQMYHEFDALGTQEELKLLTAAKFGIEQAMTIELRYPTPIGTMLGETTVPLTSGGRRDLTLQQLPAPFLDEFRRTLAELRKGGGQPAPR